MLKPFWKKAMNEISVEELKKKIDNKEDVFILDVRQPDEHRFCHISDNLIPLNELPKRAGELDPKRETVVYCHSGSRSARAVQYLTQLGFQNVRNLRGGINEWAEKIDPTMPKY